MPLPRRWIALLVPLLASCETSPTTPPPAECIAPSATSGAADPGELDPVFASAAREFGVPESLLKAIGYAETRWQMVVGGEETGLPPAYGVMALRGAALEGGAALAGVSVHAASTDPAANVRAAAALLRAHAAELDAPPVELGAWAPAVARFSGIQLPEGRASYVHDAVYGALRRGAQTAAASLAPADARPHFPAPRPSRSAAYAAVDFPPAVWHPSPNFNQRPAGDAGRVAMVIIHTCEGGYAGCWSWLANQQSQVSAHYVVDEEGAEIRQLVRESARAWHIGARYDCTLNSGAECGRTGQQSNDFTIGVEHAGYASQRSFPESQIDASARLVCDVARRNGIPRDGLRIVAHGKLQPHNRTDPGPNWPWADYLARIDRHCGAAPAAAVVVDDDNRRNQSLWSYADIPAGWQPRPAAAGAHGTGFARGSADASASPAVFHFYVARAEPRTLDAWWPAASDLSPRAALRVVAADGRELARVEVNQQTGGTRWNTLGTWTFPAGWNRVEFSRNAPNGCGVAADAVQVR